MTMQLPLMCLRGQGSQPRVPEDRTRIRRARRAGKGDGVNRAAWLAASTLGASLALTVPAQALVVTKCALDGPVGYAQFDPIAARGDDVSAHEHTWIGNRRLLTLPDRDRATYAQLQGAATSCNIATDSAAYWWPTLKTDTGSRVPIIRAEAYYRSWDRKPQDEAGQTGPIKADARMVVGNPHATGPADVDMTQTYWTCGLFSSKPASDPASRYPTPEAANCATATGVVALTVALMFPSCWDGQHNRHDVDGNTTDTPEHYAYANRGGCPASHPRKVSAVSVNVSFDYQGDGRNLTLDGEPTWTMHGDFWNGWPVDVMARMVDVCVNTTADEEALHINRPALCGLPLFLTGGD